MSVEEARIHGYLCSDGYVEKRFERNRKAAHHEIAFHADDFEMINTFKNDMLTEFNKEVKIDKNFSKRVGCISIRFCDKNIFNKISQIGTCSSKNWRLPKCLNKMEKIEWIKCFFDGDGYINKKIGNVQLKSINLDGLKSVQEFLCNININSRIYGPYKQKAKRQSDYYFLNIGKKRDILEFGSKIGFYHSRKKNILNNFISAAVA